MHQKANESASGGMIEVSHEDPHKERARKLRELHGEELKALMGRSRWMAWVALLYVTLHLGVGIGLWVGQVGLVWIAVVSWCVGAFLAHGLFVVIHEACHGLVFGRRWQNQALMLFANVPMLVPFAMPLGHYHRLHHRVQGQRGRDPDLPMEWELRLFGGSVWGRWCWHLLFPLLQLFRGSERREDAYSYKDPWFWCGVGVQLAVAAVLWVYAVELLVYLGLSCYFVFALHPLSGRFLQEHFALEGEQETNSYYGPLNGIALNFGMHNEHHDFPGIPWHRLPELSRMAPEFYLDRHVCRSWGGLWLRFLFTRELDLAQRVVRSPQDRG